jgi:protein O-GlcNAc transferase
MNSSNPNSHVVINLAIKDFCSGNSVKAKSILNNFLKEDIKNNDIILNAGILFAKNNKLLEALFILETLQQVNNYDVRIPYNIGLVRSLLDDPISALESYKEAITIDPNDVSTLINMGSLYNELESYELSLEVLYKAAKINSNIPETWSNIGYAQSKLSLYELAISSYSRAIELNPNCYITWSNISTPFLEINRLEDALEACDTSLRLNSKYYKAWLSKGVILARINKFSDAIYSYDKSLELNPNYSEAWINKGLALFKLNKFNKALSCFNIALNFKPKSAETWYYSADTFFELKNFVDAITHYDKALRLKPDYAEVWASKGITLCSLKRYKEALICFDKAIELQPDYPDAWLFKGDALNDLKEHILSANCYSKTFNLKGDDFYTVGKMHHQMMLACDWKNYDQITNQIFDGIKRGKKVAEPFGIQGIADSEELIKGCAEIYSHDLFPSLGNLTESLKYDHQKIRIGYLCGEFRKQATSILMARVWELHDKSKFELFAFDNGWDDSSIYRQRINTAFTRIIDISKLSDLDAAELIKSFEIDILINLNGFFGLPRQKVFSYKPAPIQVNYLGFPGTTGAKYMDYIIADKAVIPKSSKEFYSEKVAYLPHTYQANDNQREISNKVFTRAEQGLPENAFVFSCFNNNYKIIPAVFDSWSAILRGVESSVLWLIKDNPWVEENLKKEAEKRGVDPKRIIFADRIELPEHLARHSLADLFLDTWPYNAHTTASDALWAGLPVLTMVGNTFPGRVASSLLRAIDLSELITPNPNEYENLAIDLAKNPKRLQVIKEKLIKNRHNSPLFDSALFTKDLETAYTKMYEKFQLGMAPDHIAE